MQAVFGTEIGDQVMAWFKMFTDLWTTGFLEIALIHREDAGIFLNVQVVFRCLVQSTLGSYFRFFTRGIYLSVIISNRLFLICDAIEE